MRIEIKGRGVVVSDELRDRIVRRFDKVDRQVSPLAQLDVELAEERNPSIRESQRAELTLRLKGVTLRAASSADNMPQAIGDAADDLARQVKRHRDKRRGRRGAGSLDARPAASP